MLVNLVAFEPIPIVQQLDGNMRKISDFSYLPDEYPGPRPSSSFLIFGENVFPVSMTNGQLHVEEFGDLNKFLSDRGFKSINQRQAVLAYGSNANPVDLSLSASSGKSLRHPIIAFKCQLFDFATVLCKGARSRDRAIPATLIERIGTSENHFVLLLDPRDLPILDEKEGFFKDRNETESWYVRKPFHGKLIIPEIEWENGIEYYVGNRPERNPKVGQVPTPMRNPSIIDCF